MGFLKKTASILFSFFVLTAVSVFPAEASGSRISFQADRSILVEPGSEYTVSDLFDSFKNVLPGDVRTEEITVENNCPDYDYIAVYMKAVPLDESGNPVSPEVLSELLADERRGSRTPLSYMADFLSQLQLRVTAGGKELSSGDASETGGLTEYQLVAVLPRRKTGTVTAELTVPVTLTNEYADRIGEIEWKFLVQGYKSNPPGPSRRYIDGGGVNDWADASVWDYLRGAAYGIGGRDARFGRDGVRTGDTSNLPLYLWLLGGSAAVILLLFLLSGKKKEEEEPEDPPEENNPSEKE